MKAPCILLVEDDPDDETLTVEALRRSNLQNELCVVRDGADALDFLNARGKYADRVGQPHPALVLLDLALPKIDGMTVLREIRSASATRDIPVVVLTGLRDTHAVMES